MGSSSFSQTTLPGTESWESREQISLKTKGGKCSVPALACHLLLDTCCTVEMHFPLSLSYWMLPWKAFPFEHCHFQLQLSFGLPCYIPECLGNTSVFFLGSLILLPPSVYFPFVFEVPHPAKLASSHACLYSSTSELFCIEIVLEGWPPFSVPIRCKTTSKGFCLLEFWVQVSLRDWVRPYW